MQIKPDEITSILKQRIEGMEEGGADLSEVGTVLSIGDGIARVHGLDNCESLEMLGALTGERVAELVDVVVGRVPLCDGAELLRQLRLGGPDIVDHPVDLHGSSAGCALSGRVGRGGWSSIPSTIST